MGVMSHLQVRKNLLRIGVDKLEVFCHSKKGEYDMIDERERERKRFF